MSSCTNPSTLTNCSTSCSGCDSCFQDATTCDPCTDCVYSACSYNVDTFASTCHFCHSNCATCSGTAATDCLSCTDSNASVTGGPAACTCDGGYTNAGVSPLVDCQQACHVSCATCSGFTANDCLTCVDSNASVTGGPAACLCGSGYYNADTLPLVNCVQCHAACDTCNGPTNDDCLSCSASYFT